MHIFIKYLDPLPVDPQQQHQLVEDHKEQSAFYSYHPSEMLPHISSLFRHVDDYWISRNNTSASVSASATSTPSVSVAPSAPLQTPASTIVYSPNNYNFDTSYFSPPLIGINNNNNNNNVINNNVITNSNNSNNNIISSLPSATFFPTLASSAFIVSNPNSPAVSLSTISLPSSFSPPTSPEFSHRVHGVSPALFPQHHNHTTNFSLPCVNTLFHHATTASSLYC